MFVALSGGVGGARMAAGLAEVFPADRLRVIVNTGDDFDHWGLRICPDLDTVMYTLAGLVNEETGWGVRGDRHATMRAVVEQGGEGWFQLGDRDLVTHLTRTSLLSQGASLSQVTRRLFENLAISTNVSPATDQEHRTLLETDSGVLEFQDYFVRQRCAPRLHRVRFSSAEHMPDPSPMLAELMQRKDIEGVIICPSNPVLSVLPILEIRGVRQWLAQRAFPVVAVSPFIGGNTIKGPAAKIFSELNLPTTLAGLDAWYGKLVDGWLVDGSDRHVQTGGEIKVKYDDIMLDTAPRRAHLAQSIKAWLATF